MVARGVGAQRAWGWPQTGAERAEALSHAEQRHAEQLQAMQEGLEARLAGAVAAAVEGLQVLRPRNCSTQRGRLRNQLPPLTPKRGPQRVDPKLFQTGHRSHQKKVI